MAVEAQLYSENMGISQQWLMNTTTAAATTTPNLSPPIILPPQGFMQNMERGVGMGIGFHGCEGFVSSPCCSSFSPSMPFSQSFATLLQKQKHDLDIYLHFQGEKLRQVLQQQRRQELVLLLNSYRSRAMTLLREKKEDLDKLRMKTKILEDYLKRAEEETEAWQRVAREKEETVIGLTNMLEQVKANLCVVPTPPNYHGSTQEDNNDDAESVCDFEPLNRNRGDAGEERENGLRFDCKSLNRNRGDAGEERENGQRFDCRWCNLRCASVVFLPCKHLCCCKPCEALLGLCPVCHSVKQGSIEIFLS